MAKLYQWLYIFVKVKAKFFTMTRKILTELTADSFPHWLHPLQDKVISFLLYMLVAFDVSTLFLPWNLYSQYFLCLEFNAHEHISNSPTYYQFSLCTIIGLNSYQLYDMQYFTKIKDWWLAILHWNCFIFWIWNLMIGLHDQYL